MRGQCLFSAPFSFLGPVAADYEALMPTTFREIWRRDELTADPRVTVWVPNPGQSFVADDGVLNILPALEIIATPSTGSNHVDRTACERRGVTVYSLLDNRKELDCITASAEFTFLLLLNALRRLDRGIVEVAEGRWRSREDCLRGNELAGKQVGLVGYGRIGQRVARYCRAFDAGVAYFDPYVDVADPPRCTLAHIFSDSDVVVICCSLTDESRSMIGAELLERLKYGAVFVNTSRGEVVDENALAVIAAARPDLRVAVDVVADEVFGATNRSPLLPLHRAGRVVITPHMAGAAVESQSKAAAATLAILRQHYSRPRVAV